MADRCPGGWFGRHKFEGRYDLGPADISQFSSVSGSGSGSFMEKLRSKTYVHDICVRCGEVITRDVGGSRE